jgi:uncharacterized membrane protein required for colicin V production
MGNWLLLIVALIFILCILWGSARGFLRIGMSLLTTVITVMLISVVHPYVSNALIQYTPISEWIQTRVMESFFETAVGEESVFQFRDNLPQEYQGYVASLDAGANWDSLGVRVEDVVNALGNLTKDQQIQKIEESPLPEFLKEKLLENNNTAIYQRLNVSTFPEYIAAYIARMLVKILSYVLSFIMVWLFVNAVMSSLDFIARLPVIGGINRALGAVVGLLMALAIVWFLFLGISMLYTSELGQTCFRWIDESTFLTFLYDHNLFFRILLRF